MTILRTLLVCALGALAFGASANVPIEPPDIQDDYDRCAHAIGMSAWLRCIYNGETPPPNDWGMPADYTGGGTSAPGKQKKPPTLCETYQTYAESTGEGDGSPGGGAEAFGVAIMVTIACLGDMTFSLPAWR